MGRFVLLVMFIVVLTLSHRSSDMAERGSGFRLSRYGLVVLGYCKADARQLWLDLFCRQYDEPYLRRFHLWPFRNA